MLFYMLPCLSIYGTQAWFVQVCKQFFCNSTISLTCLFIYCHHQCHQLDEVGDCIFQINMERSNLPYAKLRESYINDPIKSEKEIESFEGWKKVSAPLDAVSKWRDYVSSRRDGLVKSVSKLTASFREGPAPKGEVKRKGAFENLNSTLRGIDSVISDDEEEKQYDQGNSVVTDVTASFEEKSNDARSGKSSLNSRTLIFYFSKLAASSRVEDTVDLDFVEGLLDNGADINMSDKHGQTILHEVARTWHIDVAKFLIEKNADIDKADKFGRTPLHLASAVNYPEMVEFLCQNGGRYIFHLFAIRICVKY